MRNPKPCIKVRALKTVQGLDIDVFAFFLQGSDIFKIAKLSRISRDQEHRLHGFQRKEIKNHVRNIIEFLDQKNVLFPNAIILALSSEIVFKQARGAKPAGLTDISQMGTLTIPVNEEGFEAAWIVDGQQRSMALSKSKNKEISIPVIGFVSDELETQREQFILVNKARPLPTRLINELLPEVSFHLPRDLAPNKIPSELCNLLNKDPDSPFHNLIKRMSDEPGSAGVITDTALIKVMKKSIKEPLGALAPFKTSNSGSSDINSMYETMTVFWSAVKDTFPDAWGKLPTESRLMHSAGIESMGCLMDKIMSRAYSQADPKEHIYDSLSKIAPYCHWTDGRWGRIGMEWNEIQNVPKHIRLLTDLLVRTDFEAMQKR